MLLTKRQHRKTGPTAASKVSYPYVTYNDYARLMSSVPQFHVIIGRREYVTAVLAARL